MLRLPKLAAGSTIAIEIAVDGRLGASTTIAPTRRATLTLAKAPARGQTVTVTATTVAIATPPTGATAQRTLHVTYGQGDS
jgi:hypothetical protein